MYQYQIHYILASVSYNTDTNYIKATAAKLRAARDAELTQDDSFSDDLLGNEIFCHDYAIKH